MMRRRNLIGALALLAWALAAPAARADFFVTDNFTGSVLDVTPSGSVSTLASGFSGLAGGAFDASGNLLVADVDPVLGFGRIRMVTPSGSVSTLTGGPALSGGGGMAFDASGNLFVANQQGPGHGGSISKVTPSGSISTFASGFNFPEGLAFNANGVLFMANFSTGTVDEVFNVLGISLVVPFASGFDAPTGLAFDASGNLYVTNALNGTVTELTTSGARFTFATGLVEPRSLAFDANGNLFVTNLTTISEVDPSGNVSTFADLSGDVPTGLAFDPADSGGLIHELLRQQQPAPEPSGLLLAVVAALGLAGYGWRRRRLATA
jgi:sugar lactone lactonase YvrE